MKIPESLEDLYEDPEKYGMPTFDQYTRNKEKYWGSKEEWLESIDKGDPMLKCKQRYFVEGYRVDSLEQAERIALDMGFNLYNDFIIRPQLRPDDAGGFYNEVNFRSKRSIEARKAW